MANNENKQNLQLDLPTTKEPKILLLTMVEDNIKEKESSSSSSSNKSNRIPFSKPCWFPECLDAIQDAFRTGKASGDGINTERVTKFFSSPKFFGHDRVLLTPSCTAALEMSALILDLQPGDEVIVPSYTFVSTANAFALRGVCLVFADSCNADLENPNVDVRDILRKITPKTKAIVVVHYAGVVIDLTPLSHLNIPIVEDCAHAIGSYYVKDNDSVSVARFTNNPTAKRQHAGLVGCLSTFSFHDTKNVAIGEGGCLVVNDQRLWEKARVCRQFGTNRSAFQEGRDSSYSWLSLGSSYLMSDVHAGLLWGCLLHYDEIQARRIQQWDFYHEQIWASSNLWQKPWREAGQNGHAYYLQFYDVNDRQEFEEFMEQHGIAVKSHYKPLDASPYILSGHPDQSCDGQSVRSKNAEVWSRSIVRLPILFELTLEQQVRIVNAVNSFSIHKASSDKDGHCWTFRPASREYWESIRYIRNENRQFFLEKGVIDAATHQSFMEKHSRTYRVAVDNTNGSVIGFYAHVLYDARAATHPLYHRKGVGKFMLKSFVREFPNVSGKILIDNHASLELNKKMGFVPHPKDLASGSKIVRLVRSRPGTCRDYPLTSKL